MLAAALVASCVPAEAGMAVRALPAAGLGRVATIPVFVAPVSNSRLTPSPLVSASLTGFWLSPGNDSAPRPLELRAAAPAAAPAALPVVAAPAASPLAAAAPIGFNAPADAPAPQRRTQSRFALDVLDAVAAPDAAPQLSARAFDGLRLRAAADAPSAAPDPGAPRGPELKKPSLYRRIVRRGVPTFYSKVQDGIGYAALGGGVFVALWGAMPWAHLPILAAISGTLAVGFVFAMDITRGFWLFGRALADKPSPAPVPVSGAKKRLALLSGLILGAGMFSAALTFEAPLIQRYHAIMDSYTEAAQRENVRAVRGDAFNDETVRILSENPVGRRILDDLRDRGGVLRLPHVFVSKSQGSIMAVHNPVFNGIYIDEEQITDLGFTVEQFLNDPEVQRQVAGVLHSTMAHELTHAVQGRRSPLEREFYQQAMEHEYEAYVNELFYAHERLKADPSAHMTDDDMSNYLSSLADLASYLRGIDERDAYQGNIHVDNERWRAWHADLAARWPAHRVEGYHLLALREQAAGRARDAARYQQRAVESAEAAGLPAPPPLPKR